MSLKKVSLEERFLKEQYSVMIQHELSACDVAFRLDARRWVAKVVVLVSGKGSTSRRRFMNVDLHGPHR